jgi:peptidoglycan hydrolase-like protein with peptidoglycan-binding domain
LFRVDDRPVVLMYGSVPAYRTLKDGVSNGPDVAELNANLIDLGFDPYGAIGDEETFGEATAAAVRRWQKADGLPATGEVELGRVVFAPGARRVTDVHVSLGQDPPGEGPSSGTPAATTPASTTPAATTPAATTPAATTPASRTPATTPASTTPAPTAPAAEKSPSHKPSSHEAAPKKPASAPPASPAEKSSKPSSEAAKEPGGGQGAGAGTEVLATTSTQQIVTLALKAEQQQLAHAGEAVTVTLPGSRIVHGRLSHVGTVASAAKGSPSEEKGSPSGEGSESPTISVTVTLDHPVAHLDQAPVSVELVKSIRHNVLTVPATALIATAAGGYAVEALEGARRVTVAVTPGMFADGYVEVQGASVREGLRVIETR